MRDERRRPIAPRLVDLEVDMGIRPGLALGVGNRLAADADRALAEAEWFLELAQLTIDIVSRRRVPSPQS